MTKACERDGLSNHPLYSTWIGMIGRCHNPNNESFEFYSSRGIEVCERWRDSIQAFIDDMGPKPTPSHTIDRINGKLGYFPTNCRWATRKEQVDNSEMAKQIVGEATIRDAARRAGIGDSTMRRRIAVGWPKEKLLEPPRSKHAKAGTGACKTAG